MATPLLRALRTSLPKERLVVAGSPAFEPLLEGLNYFDQFLPLPLGKGLGRITAEAEALKSVRAKRIFILPNSWASALAAKRAKIEERIGRGNIGRGLFLTRTLPPARNPRPMTEIYYEMGATSTTVLGPVKLSRPKDAEPKSIFGVAPGAAFGPSKIYPINLLAAAVQKASEASRLTPRIIGAPKEAPLLKEVGDNLKSLGVRIDEDSGPCPDLAAARYSISECQSLLCMDSGARHIAAGLGVPQVVLYGPTEPEWTAHGTKNFTPLRESEEEVPCLGCHKTDCPINHPCMQKIEPETVADAIVARLKNNPGSE